QNGELVLRERMSAFGYGRQPTPMAPGDDGGGWSPAVEEVIAGDRTGYRPPLLPDLCYEDTKFVENYFNKMHSVNPLRRITKKERIFNFKLQFFQKLLIIIPVKIVFFAMQCHYSSHL
ncbi:hypothetical protein, partial [Ferruginibacter sp.]